MPSLETQDSLIGCLPISVAMIVTDAKKQGIRCVVWHFNHVVRVVIYDVPRDLSGMLRKVGFVRVKHFESCYYQWSMPHEMMQGSGDATSSTR